VSATDLALAALALVAIALVGRVALSLLPPGPPGFHGLADLPITWAASHLLGSLVLVAETDLVGVLGLRASPAVLFTPWALVLVMRWLTLPGGFVPRHTPRAEIASTLARAIAFAACTLAVATAFAKSDQSHASGAVRGCTSLLVGDRPAVSTSLAVANVLAALCFCDAGMRIARRAPLGRSVVVFALSAMLVSLGAAIAERGELSSIVLCTAGGSAFAVAWLRRADKRARMLAIVASSGAALLGGLGWTFALALLTGIVVRTAAPARARTAVIAALVLAIAVALSYMGGREPACGATGEGVLLEVSRPARIAIAALLLVSAALLARKTFRSQRANTVDAIAEPRRELSALGLAAGISLVLCAAIGVLTPTHPSAAAIAPLLPICALMIGLALVRSEQPFERA
jgi:hypothetical protein